MSSPNDRRPRVVRLLAAAVAFLCAGAMLSATAPARAFKPTTHMTAAWEAMQDFTYGFDSSGAPTVTTTLAGVGKPLTLDAEAVDAVRNYPGVYMAGVSGPDAYPDILFGQSIIHPGPSDQWILALYNGARQIPQSAPNDLRRRALAFAHGVMAHAAGDYWAHSFVNHYAGGVFPSLDPSNINAQFFSDALIAAKHVIVEGYIDSMRVGLQPTGDPNQPMISPVAGYVNSSAGGALSTQQVPTGWIKQVWLDSPMGQQALANGGFGAMLHNTFAACAAGATVNGTTCPFPNDEDEVSTYPHKQAQMAAAQALIDNWGAIGSRIIDGNFYKGAAEVNVNDANRFAEQNEQLIINKICPVVAAESICDTWSVDNWMSFPFNEVTESLNQLMNELTTAAANQGLAAMQDAATTSAASVGTPGSPERALAVAQRQALISLLDFDRSGQVTIQDLQSLKGSAVQQLILSSQCPVLDAASQVTWQACFEVDELNGDLGVKNPVTNGDQNFSAQGFAAYGNAVNLIKLTFADQAGRRAYFSSLGADSDALQKLASPTVTSPWLTVLDGYPLEKGMDGVDWALWRDCASRKAVFDKLFTEPFAGFFDFACTESSSTVSVTTWYGLLNSGKGPVAASVQPGKTAAAKKRGMRIHAQPHRAVGDYRVAVQKKTKKGWHTTHRTVTRGKKDKVAIAVRRPGTYRALLPAQRGYERSVSERITICAPKQCRTPGRG